MSEKVCKNCNHPIAYNHITEKWYHWDNKMEDWDIECSQRINNREFCDCRKPESEQVAKKASG